jgi:hypothetical protein
MPATNGNSPDRLDRVERIVEALANTTADLQQDVKILLRAQVVMGDHLEKLTSEVRGGFSKLTARMDELAAAQKHADERMDALILTVDEVVRGRKQP